MKNNNLTSSALIFIGAIFFFIFGLIGIHVLIGQQLKEKAHWVDHTHRVIEENQQLYIALLNAETGQRGYLLTQNVDYLEPFNLAVGNAEKVLKKLKALTSDNSEQQVRLDRLNILVDEKLDELSLTIKLTKENSLDKALDVVKSNQGYNLMEEIRLMSREIAQVEELLLETRENDLNDAIELESYLTFTIVILTFILLIAAYFYLRKNVIRPIANTTNKIQSLGDAVISSEQEAELKALAKDTEIESMTSSIIDLQKSSQASQSTIRTQNIKLQTALRKVRDMDSASQVKDEFLATMSHELRTPLTSILGNVEMLMNGSLRKDEEDRLLFAIRSSSQQQLALVNDILDMSKIEAGKFEINPAPFNIKRVLDQLDQMFQGKAALKGLTFNVVENHEDKHLVTGDEQRITQILINLIGNAIKFTDQGQITLAVDLVDQTLVFSVTDSGIGIENEYLGHIFNRFAQADNSISRDFSGTGLGLNISKTLAELMDGDLQVDSEIGKGSTFRLVIPYVPTNEAADQVIEKFSSQEFDGLSGHVLIAEDTPELQLLEKNLLESFGLKVSLAENGQQAVELSKSLSLDLILMDMQMPVMDGLEASRLIRAQGDNTPIIALTANVLPKHKNAFMAAGCNEFIAKPIDTTLLHEVLSKYLTTADESDKTVSSTDHALADVLAENPEITAMFLDSIPDYLADLESSLKDEGWDELRKLAHTLKGTASTLMFSDIAKKAEALQFALDESDLNRIPEISQELTEALKAAQLM